ncbi:MAG: T9SS type A sorting domain-containing protein [Chitinophagaceae bacterium]|nr:T9SS type A sorting domain-containing protein [Chitinophagaceae bacterium]
MRSILLIFFLAFINAVTAQKIAEEQIIIIPVVVHVIYNTPSQNISNEQIRSQIAVLNKDYRKKNTDISNIPVAFRSVAADSKIEFRLAAIDPSGLPTDGIIRKSTSIAVFELDDKIKSSVEGGSDPWNRDQYLNIWVANLTGGILGYASSPGCAPEKDGVVIKYDVFGTTANVRPPYNKGRTTVHEIGHWLGLKHIWGDKSCGDDGIEDTPPQEGPTRGCPSGVITTCTAGAGGNMYMNFMDFTNDDCVNMFTAGQVGKMHELFQTGGVRAALLSSAKAGIAEEETEMAAAITIYPNPVINELNIRFTDFESNKNKSLIIYNHLGQVYRRITINKPTIQVNTKDFKSGLYFISTGDKKTYKFIKAG